MAERLASSDEGQKQETGERSRVPGRTKKEGRKEATARQNTVTG